jgi:hypothetical protein
LVNDCSATSSLMIDPNIQQQQLLISAFLMMHVLTNTDWRRSRWKTRRILLMMCAEDTEEQRPTTTIF